MDNWLNPIIGDLPLASVNNLAVKNLVGKMEAGGLGASAIRSYTNVVKTVVASAVNGEGEPLYPRKWNRAFIDMPGDNNPKQPSFTGEVVTSILTRTRKGKYRVLFALCASSGLRFGEALGIDVRNISPDGSNIKIVEKAWRSEVQDRLKTESGEREIDLHSSMAKMLREYIGDRESGLLLQSRHGNPLHQSNVLRRVLHPILKEIGQPKCGVHAFRRFRNTYLRNYTSTPPGLIKFWMGHAGEGMSDLYDKIKSEVAFRKEAAEKAGIGFEIPSKSVQVWQENCSLGPNGPKRTEEADAQLAANV